mgnify:CR=1 FL=1
MAQPRWLKKGSKRRLQPDEFLLNGELYFEGVAVNFLAKDSSRRAAWRYSGLRSSPKMFDSSEEFMGKLWFRQLAKRVIERKFQDT